MQNSSYPKLLKTELLVGGYIVCISIRSNFALVNRFDKQTCNDWFSISFLQELSVVQPFINLIATISFAPLLSLSVFFDRKVSNIEAPKKEEERKLENPQNA